MSERKAVELTTCGGYLLFWKIEYTKRVKGTTVVCKIEASISRISSEFYHTKTYDL